MQLIKTLLLLLLSATGFGQDPQLQLKINAITAEDSVAGIRKFYISYSISNLTDDKLTFFLNPEQLTSNVSGAMSNCPYYKILEDGQSIDAYGILWDSYWEIAEARVEEIRQEIKDPELREAAVRKYRKEQHIVALDSTANFKYDGQKFWEENHKRLIAAQTTFQPKETRSYHIRLLWRKDRYFKHDDMEFYLAENTPHYFEITINLMKEPFKDKLTTAEYSAIIQDENFIKGVFVSNKMEINFD